MRLDCAGSDLWLLIPSRKLRGDGATTLHRGEMRSRGATLAEEAVARQMAAVPTGDSSLVASIAHAFGVPTETLCTVLLLCAVLFVWRRGAMILHM